MTEANNNNFQGQKPTPQSFEKQVRFLANDTSNVIFTNHALERMEERSIVTSMVMHNLRTGHVSGEILNGNSKGDWKAKIVSPNVINDREIGVVTAILQKGRLIIITVEWEDK